ncbi:MAG: hypothetical protein ACMG50_08370 [Thermomonas sp.]
MKLDSVLCAVIVALALIVPSSIWVLGYSAAFINYSEERTASSKRWEAIAQDTEQGKIKPEPANFARYLRMQGQQDLVLAKMYGNLAESLKHLAEGLVGVAMVQAGLLGWLFNRRRKRQRDAGET